MQAFIQTHGGVLALLVSFNMIMVMLQRVCDALKVQEPAWMQSVGRVGGAIVSALSANTVAAKPAAPADPQKPV